jgi:hypothetical protein
MGAYTKVASRLYPGHTQSYPSSHKLQLQHSYATCRRVDSSGVEDRSTSGVVQGRIDIVDTDRVYTQLLHKHRIS